MKNVLITGVSGGLGRFLAKEFLTEGCCVFGYDVRERGVCEFLGDLPGKFRFDILDVREDQAVEHAFHELAGYIDQIDILVNCAGILPPGSEKVLEEFDIGGSLDVFNVNALGPLRMVKAALPFLKSGREKIVVNISSEAGSISTHADYINRYDYCMSKAALNIQSVILQRYLGAEGIKVILIHPGWMRTEMGGAEAPLQPSESAVQIKNIIDHHETRYPNMVLMDYNGSVRPW